ncbi:hypothetical protein [Mycolicibacterium peregrinum]|uniref:Uncharacterized protein n=1 Tax=Mycolicibacterium peregrinum TaxID=43304 RepID=A0A1A0V7T6_MYCPR|nr:hypothetical protein [Mycolicibacterium peregrinum]OBB79310.1 hypothetical protein A5779_13040 [Mycolicibacterium peregrinum]
MANDADAGQRFIEQQQTMESRRELCRRHQVASIKEYREEVGNEGPVVPDIVVVIEGEGKLVWASNSGKRAGPWNALVEDLLADGDSLGMFVWLFDRHAPEKASRFPQRLVHRIDDVTAIRALIGALPSDVLVEPGEGFARCEAGHEHQTFRTAAPELRQGRPMASAPAGLVEVGQAQVL